jgi:Sulfotransferase domain
MTTLDGRGPAWLGIGAQRSGTTWFTDLLTQHPLLALGTNRKKEQHLLHRIAAGLDDAESYLRLFPGDRLRGEWTPIYLPTLSTPPIAVRLCREDAPFLVLLRDPVERFASAMRLRGQRRNHWQYHVAVAYHEWMGMYAEHLDGWARVVGKERLAVMVYEEVASDPRMACERVWRRLGVEPIELQHVESASSSSAGEVPWAWPDGLREGLTELYRRQVERLRDDWGVSVGQWPSFA